MNLGATRGDDVADVRIEADVTDVLPRLVPEEGTSVTVSGHGQEVR